MSKKFIAVAGNIGVGKSSLVTRLSERLAYQPFYEPVAENPYLADFYRDMGAWAFHSQVFFLANRLRSHRQLIDHPASVVQDRSVYEDAEIFARNLSEQGYIAERDYRSYRALYESILPFLPPPDLVIYLRASVPTLLARIRRRGREFERQISVDYLDPLNRLYEDWIQRFSLCPVLSVPADQLDFVAHSSHLDLIVTKVQEKLTGKEEVVFGRGELESVNSQGD
ncbi:MAG: deoxynucleoside kinase [Anaerolineales bacterium]|jgi:deoxyadenosine/deoxycytidine kinase